MKGDAGLMKEAPLSFAPSVGWWFGTNGAFDTAAFATANPFNELCKRLTEATTTLRTAA